MSAPKEMERYTYADYYSWDDGGRWELIDGEAYAMLPAPTQAHQEASGEIFGQLREFLKDKPCKLYAAPFDVRLNADDKDDTVVQPDLLVVCDSAKLDGKCCKGSPDLVIEILSPSTEKRDRITKLEVYRRAGVREYWIVDPSTKSVHVHTLKDGLYFIMGYADEDNVPITVLPGCEINLKNVFATI